MTRVAINGLGRVGRATLRALLADEQMEVVAVNDVADPENIAYLLRNDSVYGHRLDAAWVDSRLVIAGHPPIQMCAEQDPADLPWRDLDVDVVFECTGIFTTEDSMRHHLDAGARRVVLSAPAKGGDVATVVPGVNDADADGAELVSTASCTTNCIAPVMEVLDRRIGVRKATMTTVHAYTTSQTLVDGPSGKWRRGRAAAVNIVPTTTGAANATGVVVPSVDGVFDGVALRVPVPAGSIADIVALVDRETSTDEVNDLFRAEAESDRYRGILGVSDDPLVSSDVVGDDHGSLVDLTMTSVTGGDLVKVMAWYDNEWGYARQMVRHVAGRTGS